MKKSVVELLLDCLGETLSGRGFKKKGRTWYRENEDTVSIVHLQVSQADRCCYVNLGVFIPTLADSSVPKINDSQLFERLDTLVDEGTAEKRLAQLAEGLQGERLKDKLRRFAEGRGPVVPFEFDEGEMKEILARRPRIDRALSLDWQAMSEKERRTVINHALESAGIAFLDRYDSLNKICQALKKGTLRDTDVWIVVREYCRNQPSQSKPK